MAVWFVALLVVVGWYLRIAFWRGAEGFADYLGGEGGSLTRGPDSMLPELAELHQNPLVLGDVLPVSTGLTPYGAADVAFIDTARQMEPAGQYLQRTNNYRRVYPDNGSALLSEFVGSVYTPKDGVGAVVPCLGAC